MPKRMLKDWTASERIDNLSFDQEVFFTRLIMKADDYGRFYGNSKLLKSALFPLKDITTREIENMLLACVKVGIIETYEVDGKKYLEIKDFDQRLRARVSRFPAHDSKVLTNDGKLLSSVSKVRPELEGEDEEEIEEKGKAHNFEDNFLRAFDEITLERYKFTFTGLDLAAELQQFRTKCDNDPDSYHRRDVPGLRTAFQYQLKNSKANGKSKSNNNPADKLAEAARIIKQGSGGTA